MLHKTATAKFFFCYIILCHWSIEMVVIVALLDIYVRRRMCFSEREREEDDERIGRWGSIGSRSAECVCLERRLGGPYKRLGVY